MSEKQTLNFNQFGLHERILKALEKQSITDATEVQAQTLEHALKGKDLMVSAKTGSGKTLAFLLPMLSQFIATNKPRSSTRGLILVPTRELALQIQKEFEKTAAFTFIKCGLIIGGELYRHQVATLRKNPEVIIATPGRLVEHIEKGNTDFEDIELLVLDEADRMLDMGFAENMNTVANVCNAERQNLLFSATLQHKSISKVSGIFSSPISLEIDDFRSGHSQITQQMILADNDKHKELLSKGLIEAEKAERVIVFCNTRLQCQKVANVLASLKIGEDKIRAAYIHGELSQSERKQILNQFRDKKFQVLVATDVAARGLDIDDVDLVINFTVAQSGDDHVHRVGRTGRADKEGLAVTLVNADEWNLMAGIERYLKIKLERRKLAGLAGHYKGPKKLKASGKAAGNKKKTKNKAGVKSKRPANKKPAKKKVASTKLTESNSTASKSNDKKIVSDGTAPFRLKKKKD